MDLIVTNAYVTGNVTGHIIIYLVFTCVNTQPGIHTFPALKNPTPNLGDPLLTSFSNPG